MLLGELLAAGRVGAGDDQRGRLQASLDTEADDRERRAADQQSDQAQDGPRHQAGLLGSRPVAPITTGEHAPSLPCPGALG